MAPAEGYSPSAAKPALVVEDWQARGLPIDLHAPEPVTTEDLARAHDPVWVADVLACRAKNGFGTRSEAVARSLPYTSGAMLAAARAALENGRVAVAPVSGFHHAGYAGAYGYCTFNGLAVTAAALLAEGRARRVGILDADQHQGDGTAEILARCAFGRDVRHVSVGADFLSPSQADAFLAGLAACVEGFADCDVLLYQAGADPHVDDPLGGWLTTEQLRRRDATVFEVCRARGLPVAWDLAGGYQRDAAGGIPAVLEIHRNTMTACARVFAP